eukprot:TRINITY_DN6070_c0_g1_i1.p1 TRINITY_DN6070_c0_g1~~TRINITY_DN6070_c0_g1_i1.p1  ORF type:complete len:185 (+),score=14.09 TRINITY_DN6070_c0_g1_i1:74-628(+)
MATLTCSQEPALLKEKHRGRMNFFRTTSLVHATQSETVNGDAALKNDEARTRSKQVKERNSNRTSVSAMDTPGTHKAWWTQNLRMWSEKPGPKLTNCNSRSSSICEDWAPSQTLKELSEFEKSMSEGFLVDWCEVGSDDRSMEQGVKDTDGKEAPLYSSLERMTDQRKDRALVRLLRMRRLLHS